MTPEDLVEAVRRHRATRYPDGGETMFAADRELYEAVGLIEPHDSQANCEAGWQHAKEARERRRRREEG